MIEYKVRPVTRYVVTRYEQGAMIRGISGAVSGSTGTSSQKGEFDNEDIAYEVAYALCKDEHERLGYPPGDERIQYPKR